MESQSSKMKLLYDIIWEMVQESNGVPIPVLSETGQSLGIFVPLGVPEPQEPPELTPEEQAEFQYRLDNIDDTVTTEEMIAWLKKDLRELDEANARNAASKLR
ncbi:MAG: hypothetical protein K8T89_23325 [Planctomycetes bacterium]|nr:hypothetical protein [Planctomycetota bacterium]